MIGKKKMITNCFMETIIKKDKNSVEHGKVGINSLQLTKNTKMVAKVELGLKK